MEISFQKMHGLGNDFVVIDATETPVDLTQEQRALLAHRRYGVGCDQLLVLAPSRDERSDLFLHLYNPDGGAIEACGNGTRCAARLWMEKQGRDSCIIETLGGLLQCRLAGDGMVEVDMGVPRFGWRDIPLAEERDTLALSFPGKTDAEGVAVNIGNPHCVFFVNDAETIDLAQTGPAIENDPLFPARTNVEFAQVLAPDKIRMRVWERGAGITMACGSGACATLAAAAGLGLAGRRAEIVLDGGSLMIEWREEDDHVLMAGPAVYVFSGWLNL